MAALIVAAAAAVLAAVAAAVYARLTAPLRPPPSRGGLPLLRNPRLNSEARPRRTPPR